MNAVFPKYTLDYKNQCAAWTRNPHGPARKQCEIPPNQNIDGWIYVCHRHYDTIFRAVEMEVNEARIRQIENMRERLIQLEAQLGDRKEPSEFWSIEDYEARRKAQTVYFIRCEQYVKIGISYDPAVRLNQIRKGGGSLFPKRMDVHSAELITTESGGFDREKETARKVRPPEAHGRVVHGGARVDRIYRLAHGQGRIMPSRFQDLEPHASVPNRHPQWDHYDDMPLDPAYIAPLGLAACTRKPTV